MTTIPILGNRIDGPWFRVVSLTAPRPAGSAEQDFVSILPAALAAVGRGCPLVVGWLSRGVGSPLELITNAAASEPGPQPPLLSPAPPPSAALAASIFHYGTYSIEQTKRYLAERGVVVRLTEERVDATAA